MNPPPSDNYLTAITDPERFFGRGHLLDKFGDSPYLVWVLLGGRRIGKTSTLRALERRLMLQQTKRSAFPVFIPMGRYQPRDLDHFRFVCIDALRQAMERFRGVLETDLRRRYQAFLSILTDVKITFGFFQGTLKIPHPEEKLSDAKFLEALHGSLAELLDFKYEGICFLFDECEEIVGSPHADDICAYLRDLKDNNIALKPRIGYVLSGYRGVAEYKQKIGSQLLHIGQKPLDWLDCLAEADVRALIASRAAEEAVDIDEEATAFVLEWGGGHPFLTQQLVTAVFDCRRNSKPFDAPKLAREVRRAHGSVLDSWWNPDAKTDGFSERERAVYRAIQDGPASLQSLLGESLLARLNLSEDDVLDSLDLITGTGVVLSSGDRYETGSRLFSEWVRRREDAPHAC